MNDQQSKTIFISMYLMFFMSIFLSFVFSMMDSSRIAVIEETLRRVDHYKSIRITVLEEKVKALEEAAKPGKLEAF